MQVLHHSKRKLALAIQYFAHTVLMSPPNVANILHVVL